MAVGNRPDEDPPDETASSSPLLVGQGRVSARVVFFTIAAMTAIVIVGSRLFPEPDYSATSDSSAQVLESPGTEGDLVPLGTFEMFDGSTATFADFAGEPLVVNFFASWCAPCRAEMPDFQAVHEDLGDRVIFLGFAFQDRDEDARALVEEAGVTYRLATDPGQFQAAFGGIAMPTTAFVDEDGRILEVHSGRLDEGDLRERIAEHFGISS